MTTQPIHSPAFQAPLETALVTGASAGLGRALTIALIRSGVRVAGVARRPEALEALRDELGEAFEPIVADMADPEAATRVAAAAQAALGHVDLLVHNASSLGPVPLRSLVELSAAELAEVFSTNVVGPHALTRRIAGAMALRGTGTVVAISSDVVDAHYPGWGAYAASKAAHDHLLGTLAEELPAVRFWSVDPGEMDTRMHADALPDADPATLRRPEHVAQALLATLPTARSGQRTALEVSP